MLKTILNMKGLMTIEFIMYDKLIEEICDNKICL